MNGGGKCDTATEPDRETLGGGLVSAVDHVTEQAGKVREMVLELRVRLIGRERDQVLIHGSGEDVDHFEAELKVSGDPVQLGLLEDVARQARNAQDTLSETAGYLSAILAEL